jgi:hypothetical protein
MNKPIINATYIWERMPVVVRSIEVKHTNAKEYSDGSISSPYDTYIVGIEYKVGDVTHTLRTPFTTSSFKLVEGDE